MKNKPQTGRKYLIFDKGFVSKIKNSQTQLREKQTKQYKNGQKI